MLRTALALSLVTNEPVRMKNIRAGRPKPGLMRQHLTAVQAAAAASNGVIEGAAVGSTELTFRPGSMRGGDYHFAVGTAGSATLVLQTILPALMTGTEKSTMVLEGGTHNPQSPPFEFLANAFLPLLQRMGPVVHASLDRSGFYPAGGGRFRVTIEPCAKLAGFELAKARSFAVVQRTGHCGIAPKVDRGPRASGRRREARMEAGAPAERMD